MKYRINCFFKQLFQGRINRISFLKRSIAIVLPFIGLFIFYWLFSIVELILGVKILSGDLLSFLYPIFGLMWFVCYILLSLSFLIRRHHDFNQSWIYPALINIGFVLLSLINIRIMSLGMIIYFIYLVMIEGTAQDNDFGEPN